MSLVSPNSGDIIQSSHITQLTGLVAGTAGLGQVVNLTDVGSASWDAANSGSDASTLWALTVRNQDTTNGQHFRVQNSSGTTIFSVTDDGTAFGGGVSGQVLLADGTVGAPSLSNTGDTNVGLYFPAADNVAIGGGGSGVTWVFNAASGTTDPRSYIVDAAGTTAQLTLTRGTSTSDGNVPDGSYTGALMVTSFHAGNSTDYTAEAIKGAVYAAEGAGGLHIGVSGVAEIPSAGSWTASGTHGVLGLFGQATSHKASGRTWGGNLIAKQITGAAATVTGLEVGVEAQVATTNRYGIQIVTLASGTNRGATEDIGLKFADKTSPTSTGNLWTDLISVGSPGTLGGTTGWPVVSTGTILNCYGKNDGSTVQAGIGIDLSTVFFGTAALRSQGFMVSPSGRIGAKVAGVDGTAPLRVDCTDDTNLIVIDNIGTVVQTTVGAAGGASALPLTPTGYLMLKVGATSAVIPFYAKS